MQCAPLWDASRCQFVGLLTVTDFIDVLRYYRFTRTDVSTLATRTIAEILSDGAIMLWTRISLMKFCSRGDDKAAV